MMQQYTRIKAQHPDTLLFFRLGDFYELFGEDAKIAAKVLEITLTSRDRTNKDNPLPMCGVPHHAASNYLQKLIENGYKVAVCEQLEDPKASKGVVKRDVIRVITPGTFLEGYVEEKNNVYLVGIAESEQQYGLAVVDLSTGEFNTALIDDPDNFRDEIIRLNPAEIVIAKSHTTKFDELTEQITTTITITDDRNWLPETCSHILQKHFQINRLDTLGLDHDLLIQVAGAVLTYLQETQKATLEHIKQIHRYSLNQFMHIDGSSHRNLELTKTIRERKKTGSLLGVLDRTITGMGGRLLRSWIEKPLIEIEQIKKRQTAISILFKDSMLQVEIRDLLANISDLERLLSRIVYGNGNARDLSGLKISLKQIPKIKQLLDDHSTDWSGYTKQLNELTDLTDLIECGIKEEAPISVREGNLIKDGFNKELDKLRSAKQEGRAWIASLEVQERKSTGIKSLKVGFNRVFGYYLEVTKTNIKHVPDHYQRKQTLANSERFITPELKEKEALILGAEERITELEYQLFCQIRDHVKQYITEIQQNAHLLALFDVFQALSAVARDHNYVCPEITPDMDISIVDGRHPVIESLQQDFIPNDLSMSGQNQIVLLTGPNMAGKSTFLRQIALIVILAQMGSFVPASTARIGVVDRIFTRIGAADDLSMGQSTFMVECSETANLVRHATKKSLIILDELGRGTSTFDGMAIAQAVIEYIHKRVKARTLFSTHYHELTQLEKSLRRLSTYQMAVEDKHDKVYFLHKVIPGNADKSYGINVAKMAGIPEEIVQRAKKLLYEFEANQKKPVQLDLLHSLNHPAATAEQEIKNDISAQVIKKLKQIDVNQLTPLAALQLVAEIKDRIKKDEQND